LFRNNKIKVLYKIIVKSLNNILFKENIINTLDKYYLEKINSYSKLSNMELYL